MPGHRGRPAAVWAVLAVDVVALAGLGGLGSLLGVFWSETGTFARSLAVVVPLLAVGLAAAMVGLWQRRPWGRSANITVLWLAAAAVLVFLFPYGAFYYLGLHLIATGVTILLLTRRSRTWLTPDSTP